MVEQVCHGCRRSVVSECRTYEGGRILVIARGSFRVLPERALRRSAYLRLLECPAMTTIGAQWRIKARPRGTGSRASPGTPPAKGQAARSPVAARERGRDSTSRKTRRCLLSP